MPHGADADAQAVRCVGEPAYGGAVLITVVEGDLTTQQVDAVVNAANRRMRGGGGVDGAIHAAGGPEVLADCRRRFPDGLATGDAGWTTAGRMPARWVIHVVGPNRHRGETDRALLVSCYARAIEVAEELGARTVAFPLVGAGVYGWSREESVDAALEACDGADGATDTRVEEVRLVAFGSAALAEVTRSLAEHEHDGWTEVQHEVR